jgi:hypothetical protein
MLGGFTISKMENVHVVTIGEYNFAAIAPANMCPPGPVSALYYQPSWL